MFLRQPDSFPSSKVLLSCSSLKKRAPPQAVNDEIITETLVSFVYE